MFGNPSYAKLSITAVGLASGILSAVAIVAYSVMAYLTGYGIELESTLEGLNPGYSLSIGGTIIGVIWDFALGYIFGVIFAWLYNNLSEVKK